jgi:hypothetical protein
MSGRTLSFGFFPKQPVIQVAIVMPGLSSSLVCYSLLRSESPSLWMSFPGSLCRHKWPVRCWAPCVSPQS